MAHTGSMSPDSLAVPQMRSVPGPLTQAFCKAAQPESLRVQVLESDGLRSPKPLDVCVYIYVYTHTSTNLNT